MADERYTCGNLQQSDMSATNKPTGGSILKSHLARDFHAAIAFIDDTNVNCKPLAANDCSGGGFDKLYAHHGA